MNFLLLVASVALASLSPLFLEETQFIDLLYPKTLIISVILLMLTYLFWKRKPDRLLIMVLFLIVFRIGFNWYILPARNAGDFGNLCRVSSKEVGKTFIKDKIYVYKYTLMAPTNSLYLTNERGAIIERKLHDFDKEALYIIEKQRYPFLEYEKVGEFQVRHGKQTYDVGYLK